LEPFFKWLSLSIAECYEEQSAYRIVFAYTEFYRSTNAIWSTNTDQSTIRLTEF
jgi:hypothetical protein